MPGSLVTQRLKDWLKVYAPALVLVILGFVLAYQFVDPAPPDHLSIATGSTSGAYYRNAQRYQKILAHPDIGITLDIRTTAGSSENLELLNTTDSPVELAFVQGGMEISDTEISEGADPLLSLASVYYEPLWVFHRDLFTAERLTDFAEKRIAIGEEGSGTRALALDLLAENGISGDSLLPLGGDDAAQSLQKGEVDAAFFVASPESSVVRTLLQAENVRLMDFSRAKAYTRRHRYISNVELPAGVINLENNIPDKHVTLVATTATLVARSDLHPALVDLVLQAASEVHSEQGTFENAGQFPSPNYVTFPLSKDARRYFVHGPPFLQNHMPFWAASLIDRLKVMLLPLLVLLVPLLKILPPTYRWRVRSKIYRWYKELQAIESRFRESESGKSRGATLDDLCQIEKEIARVNVPLSYADELYNLRLHIKIARERIEASTERSTS
jgi:TRAP transporter TAXI family solute receptor